MSEQERMKYEQLLVIGALSMEVERINGDVRELVTDEQAAKIVELAEKYMTYKPEDEQIADVRRILVEKIAELLEGDDGDDATGE